MNNQVFENYIKEVVPSVAVSNGISNYELNSIDENAKGQGYQSKIFTVLVSDKSNKQKLHLIFKLAFKAETGGFMQQIFENEIYFYSVVYPTLEKFRQSVGCKEVYNLIPKYYQTSPKEEMKCLVLENLKFQNFQVFDKYLSLTNEHFELIFQRYGYFHAHSLALKDQSFLKYSDIVAKIKNMLQVSLDMPGFDTLLKDLCGEVYKIFVPGKDDKLIQAFKKYLDKCIELYRSTIDDGGKYSTILHGDCWSNNMLFKYDNISGKPIDMRLVDWQILKTGSPVCDLSYALYSAASKSNLDKLDDYLKIYYTSLSSTLRNLGSDPTKILTLNQLKEQWKVYSKYGFMMGMIVIRNKCIQNEDLEESSEDNSDATKKYLKTKYNSEKFAKTVYDLANHMLEIGAL